MKPRIDMSCSSRAMFMPFCSTVIGRPVSLRNCWLCITTSPLAEKLQTPLVMFSNTA